ncbi:MAG TPA: PAAR domain-containing protein [Allosphingosinicella sp.]|jgi:uncharacterized Zn-binding protein involved in type VI secretion
MATPSDFAALSQAVYAGPGSTAAPPGWSKIAESPSAPNSAGSANGYFGAAYRDDATGEIVLANRGSRPTFEGLKQDWGTSDVQIAAQGSLGVPGAFNDAEDFGRSVKAANPDATISYTGHSLGGAEAQVQAGRLGGHAMTFAAPGAAFALSEQQRAAAQTNVVNFVLPGDPVGMCGDHVGQRVAITPTGFTTFKTVVAVGAGIALGGFFGLLVGILGLAGANHPLGNYIAALAAMFSGAGGGGKPQARITDPHVCPMVTGLVPHVGGPIVKGCPTVLVGGLPAARVTDLATCVGPIDVIVLGSATVIIGGVQAARLGDMTAHGGRIVAGLPTVLTGG